MKVPLSGEHLSSLTFQQYGPQPEIAGVFCKPLKKHRALEGAFMELFRLTGGGVEGLPANAKFDLRQLSLSQAEPGRINAFHVHPKEVQDELWCVVQGSMAVWLVDLRQNSPTLNVRRRFVLSGEEPAILHIPAGVAHGYKAAPHGALLLYAVNSQFDIKNPNEGRLPWNHFGAELWEEDRG